MAGQNAARLAVQLALESGTFSADVQAAIDKFVKLPNAIKRESKSAAKDIELMRYAIADYGKEVSYVTKMQRELYGEFGKYKNAAAEQHGLAMSMLQVAHAMDKQVESQKKLGEQKLGGLNAQQKAALGYQTTDIITSLAGGQNPMLVLLQQGGQLRDQFGGFGALFRGIASAVTLTGTAMTLLGVGIGAVVYATYQGNEELKKFNNELLLSGNLANQTYDKYINASHALAQSQNVSIKTAKEAYGAVAASGQFTEKSILSVSTAITAFARTAGVSGTEAAQKLIPAFSGGARSIKELNDQYNFLTLKQYQVVSAATSKSGNVALQMDIIKMASEALTKQIEKSIDNLGYFDKLFIKASDFFTLLKEWGANNRAKDVDNLTKSIVNLQKAYDAALQSKNTFPKELAQRKQELEDAKAELKRLQNNIADEEAVSKKSAEDKEKVRKYKASEDQAGGPGAGVKKRYELEREQEKANFQLQVANANEFKKIELENSRDIKLAQIDDRERTETEGSHYALLNQQLLAAKISEINAETIRKKNDLAKKGIEKDYQLSALNAESEFQMLVQGLDKFKRIDLQAARDMEIEKSRIVKLNAEERNLWQEKNALELEANLKRIYQKAESDKAELARSSFEEVRKNLQTQQNSVDLEREKLAIYEKNFLISDADYKIELLKLETKQKMKEIDDNPNLDAAKKAEGKAMVLELQRSKTAVDQLDVRLKLLKDSGAFVFKSLEDAIIQFTRTGKLSFKDLVGSVLRGLLEMQIRAQSTKLFAMLGSFLMPAAGNFSLSGGGGSGLGLTPGGGGLGLTSGGGLGLMPRASGGSVSANDSYMVGENGPEMFVPRQSGTIIPNNQMSSMGNQPQVIYNGPYIASMSAIDTQSAAQFLAKNKNSVWSANQSAARGLPTNR
jgi:phage-related minor tail protein